MSGEDDPSDFSGVGRNDLCPCGSGLKFKKCHFEQVKQEERLGRERDAEEALVDSQLLISDDVFDGDDDEFDDPDPYNPAVAPDPEAWLALDESERIRKVDRAHRDVEFPPETNRRAHAVVQAIVENRLAMGNEEDLRIFEKTLKETGDRHEALHAVGLRVTDEISKALRKKR